MNKEKIVLIKPVSGLCNMSCSYCFYKDEEKNREEKKIKVMEKETYHALIDKVSKVSSSPLYMFQGGEPTLWGLECLKDFVRVAKSKGNPNFALQTNGYILDKEWIAFLEENSFLLGLSLDGNKKLHDKYRLDKTGEGTYKKVYKSFQLLKNSKVQFNVLSVITKESVKNVKGLINFIEANQIKFVQELHALNPLGEDETEYSITAEEYGFFLIELFDWYYKKIKEGDYYSVRYFDNIIRMQRGFPPESCGLSGVCGCQYVVEADGSVYPCDFYVLDGYSIGNILTDSFSTLDANRRKIRFQEDSFVVLDECKVCPYFSLCRGGCRRDRENFKSNKIEKSRLCTSYKMFFDKEKYKIEELARLI